MEMTMVLSVLCLGVVAAAGVYAVIQGRALKRAQDEQQRLCKQVEMLQTDVAALCAGARGVGSHLGRIERHLMRLVERQDQLETREVTHREYDHAVRLVQRGAGVEELLEQCHMQRAEAELLLRLHAPSPANVRPGQLGSREIRSVA